MFLNTCIHLSQKCLKYNPSHRISAKEALDHPFFRDLDKKTLPAFGVQLIPELATS